MKLLIRAGKTHLMRIKVMNELDLFSEFSDDEARREVYRVTPPMEGVRLDKFLSEVTELTRC